MFIVIQLLHGTITDRAEFSTYDEAANWFWIIKAYYRLKRRDDVLCVLMDEESTWLHTSGRNGEYD